MSSAASAGFLAFAWLPCGRALPGVRAPQGLIIPGGESTTMALVCERWGLVDELRSFAGRGRPVWGTCAGMIFLASGAHNAKEGGQALLGGLPVTVSRNFFGAQINSFECDLEAPATLPDAGAGPCRALFIRAPAILDASDGVDVLARYHLTEARGCERGAQVPCSGSLHAAPCCCSCHRASRPRRRSAPSTGGTT